MRNGCCKKNQVDCGVSNSNIKYYLNFDSRNKCTKSISFRILKTDIARCVQKLGIILENKAGISITYRYVNLQNRK